MAFLTLQNISLSAVAATVPKQTEHNRDLRFPGVNNELLIKTVGIEQRRIAPPGLTAADLCMDAAKRLMGQASIPPHDIDILVVVTQTPDHPIPGSSMYIQDKLGLSMNCICFDINQGCAGYVYGLSVIGSMMQSGRFGKGLLLVGDTITNTIAKEDASLVPVFSDAGSATLLEYKEHAAPWYFHLQSDGSGFDKIIVKGGGTRNPRDPGSLYMNGQDIFNFGLKEVPGNIASLLQHFHIPGENVDHFIMHQANFLLNESIRKKTGFDASKTLYSLKDLGNTSCASVPVTLSAHSATLDTKTENLLLAGFGVGLSWGSCFIPVNDFICIPIGEI